MDLSPVALLQILWHDTLLYKIIQARVRPHHFFSRFVQFTRGVMDAQGTIRVWEAARSLIHDSAKGLFGRADPRRRFCDIVHQDGANLLVRRGRFAFGFLFFRALEAYRYTVVV